MNDKAEIHCPACEWRPGPEDRWACVPSCGTMARGMPEEGIVTAKRGLAKESGAMRFVAIMKFQLTANCKKRRSN